MTRWYDQPVVFEVSLATIGGVCVSAIAYLQFRYVIGIDVVAAKYLFVPFGIGLTLSAVLGFFIRKSRAKLLRHLNTERKDIESLRSTQGKLEVNLQAVIETVHDGIITIDNRGSILTFNSAAQKQFGYLSDEVIGKNVKCLMPEPYRGEHDEYLARYITTRDAKIIGIGREVIGKRKDGSTFPMDLSVNEMMVGEAQMFVGVVRDITERRQAEASLYEITDRLISSQQIAHVGSWDWDIPSGGLVWTAEIYAIFGRLPENFAASYENFLECIHPDDRNKVINAVGQAVEHDTPYDVEHRIVHPNGALRFVQEKGKVYRNEEGVPIRMLGVVHDITERTLLDRAKSEFISTVSHELRTPLTSINGSLSLIRSGVLGELPDKVQKMVGIAYDNGKRLILLINDILDIEKIEAGKIEMPLKPMSVVALVKETIAANKAYGDEYGVTFTCVDCDQDYTINGNKDRLLQVMANLMSNAAKFSPRGEQVTLSITHNENKVRISVKDLGSGIPESFREKVFEKFTQADGSDSRQKGGTGLGLSIAKMIVEHHGGTIGFRDNPDAGTVFFVDLPRLMIE